MKRYPLDYLRNSFTLEVEHEIKEVEESMTNEYLRQVPVSDHDHEKEEVEPEVLQYPSLPSPIVSRRSGEDTLWNDA